MTSIPTTPTSPTGLPVGEPGCRRFHISESAANSLTHALGLVLAMIGAPLLVMLANRVGNSGHVSRASSMG